RNTPKRTVDEAPPGSRWGRRSCVSSVRCPAATSFILLSQLVQPSTSRLRNYTILLVDAYPDDGFCKPPCSFLAAHAMGKSGRKRRNAVYWKTQAIRYAQGKGAR